MKECVLEFVQEEGGTYQKCTTHGAYVGGECLGRVADLEADLARVRAALEETLRLHDAYEAHHDGLSCWYPREQARAALEGRG